MPIITKYDTITIRFIIIKYDTIVGLLVLVLFIDFVQINIVICLKSFPGWTIYVNINYLNLTSIKVNLQHLQNEINSAHKILNRIRYFLNRHIYIIIPFLFRESKLESAQIKIFF